MKRFPYPRSNMNIVIYGKKKCYFCKAAKNLLDKVGLSYTYYDINDLVKKKILKKPGDIIDILGNKTNNYKTVPMIFIYGDFLGGFTQLHELINHMMHFKNVPTLNELSKNFN